MFLRKLRMIILYVITFGHLTHQALGLSPPVGLSATDVSTHSMTVAWRATEPVNTYEATISPLDEGETAEETQFINDIYATWVDLVPGKNYTVDVIAFSNDGRTSSAPASDVFTTQPMSPYQVRVSKFVNPVLSEYQVDGDRTMMFPVYGAVIVWENPDVGYFNGYNISVSPPDGVIRLPIYLQAAVPIPQALKTRRIIWDLVPGIWYDFGVQTRSGEAFSDMSVVGERMPPEIPSPIKIVRVSPTDIVLSWDEPHRGILDGFVVEIDPPTGDVIEPADPTEKRRLITGLTPGSIYDLDIYSTSFGVLSFKPRTKEIKTPPARPIGPVETIRSTTNAITISWKRPTGVLDYYEVVYFPTHRDVNRLRHRVYDTVVELTSLETNTSYSLIIFAVSNLLYSKPLYGFASTGLDLTTTAQTTTASITTSTTGATLPFVVETESADEAGFTTKAEVTTSISPEKLIEATTLNTVGPEKTLAPHHSIPYEFSSFPTFPTTKFFPGRVTTWPNEETTNKADAAIALATTTTQGTEITETTSANALPPVERGDQDQQPDTATTIPKTTTTTTAEPETTTTTTTTAPETTSTTTTAPETTSTTTTAPETTTTTTSAPETTTTTTTAPETTTTTIAVPETTTTTTVVPETTSTTTTAAEPTTTTTTAPETTTITTTAPETTTTTTTAPETTTTITTAPETTTTTTKEPETTTTTTTAPETTTTTTTAPETTTTTTRAPKTTTPATTAPKTTTTTTTASETTTTTTTAPETTTMTTTAPETTTTTTTAPETTTTTTVVPDATIATTTAAETTTATTTSPKTTTTTTTAPETTTTTTVVPKTTTTTTAAETTTTTTTAPETATTTTTASETTTTTTTAPETTTTTTTAPETTTTTTTAPEITITTTTAPEIITTTTAPETTSTKSTIKTTTSTLTISTTSTKLPTLVSDKITDVPAKISTTQDVTLSAETNAPLVEETTLLVTTTKPEYVVETTKKMPRDETRDRDVTPIVDEPVETTQAAKFLETTAIDKLVETTKYVTVTLEGEYTTEPAPASTIPVRPRLITVQSDRITTTMPETTSLSNEEAATSYSTADIQETTGIDQTTQEQNTYGETTVQITATKSRQTTTNYPKLTEAEETTANQYAETTNADNNNRYTTQKTIPNTDVTAEQETTSKDSTLTPSATNEVRQATTAESTTSSYASTTDGVTTGGPTKPSERVIPIRDGFSTICKPNNITILVDQDVIGEYESKYGPLHLNDHENPACRGVKENGVYRYTIAPNILDCGTQMELNETHVNFTNTVSNSQFRKNWLQSLEDRSGSVILGSRVPRLPMVFIHMQIWCTFPIDLNVTSEYPFIPEIPMQILTFNISGRGEFSAVMQLYRTGAYAVPYLTPPALTAEETLYVGINLLESQDDSTFMVVRKCWATPDRSPDHPGFYSIIEDYCALPENLGGTVKINKNGVSKQIRWEGSVFKFVNYDHVWLHCEIKICFGDKCQPNCSDASANSRSKRSNERVHVLSTGPIVLNKNPGGLSKTTETPTTAAETVGIEETTVLIIVAALSAVIILCCIVIVCVMAKLKRKRQQRHKSLESATSASSAMSDFGKHGGGRSSLEDYYEMSRPPADMGTFCKSRSKNIYSVSHSTSNLVTTGDYDTESYYGSTLQTGSLPRPTSSKKHDNFAFSGSVHDVRTLDISFDKPRDSSLDFPPPPSDLLHSEPPTESYRF